MKHSGVVGMVGETTEKWGPMSNVVEALGGGGVGDPSASAPARIPRVGDGAATSEASMVGKPSGRVQHCLEQRRRA
jgi:hypothetical protein